MRVSDFGETPAIATKDFTLHQNFPNPFNAATTIQFNLTHSAQVTLKIYNLLGNEIATLLQAPLPSGNHSMKWLAENLPSGIYLCQLQVNHQVETRKLILQR